MWADVLTKPLEGAEYKVLCGKIMNIPVDYDATKPFQTDLTTQENKVTFAKGTKPGTDCMKTITSTWRLEECFWG